MVGMYAPLDAAREAQGQLEARIRELEGMLRHAMLVDNDDPYVHHDDRRRKEHRQPYRGRG